MMSSFPQCAFFLFTLIFHSVMAVNDVPTTAAEWLVYLHALESNNSALFLNDDPLVSTVDRILNKTYAAYPSIKSDAYYPSIGYELNYLTLNPVNGSDLYHELHAISDSVDGANFSTGIDAFDSIHNQAILSSVTRQAYYSWSDWFILRYENGWVNLEELTRRYTASELDDEIEWVETNMFMGGATSGIT